MDFSTKFTVRTDLADEVLEQLSREKGKIGDGIGFEKVTVDGTAVEYITVENDEAGERIGKPKGRYATLKTGEIWKSDSRVFRKTAGAVSKVLSDMLPQKGLCLAVCLGNESIVADALGPLVSKNLIVTRHIRLQNESLYNSLGLSECACIVPGVMGDTGAEAFELVKGAVQMLEPSSVVVVDALASRNISRLAKTVQICDSGISPGSGVGNARHEISEKTLGVPTVAVGVPTVVEAQTLCLDMLSEALCGERKMYNYIEKRFSGKTGAFYVCPKETDRIIRSMAKLVGYSLNLALHGDMTLSEMDEFLA